MSSEKKKKKKKSDEEDNSPQKTKRREAVARSRLWTQTYIRLTSNIDHAPHSCLAVCVSLSLFLLLCFHFSSLKNEKFQNAFLSLNFYYYYCCCYFFLVFQLSLLQLQSIINGFRASLLPLFLPNPQISLFQLRRLR